MKAAYPEAARRVGGWAPVWVLAGLLLFHAAASAQTTHVIAPGNAVVLEQALNAGGEVFFNADGTTTLTNTLVIATNVVLDGGGTNAVTISGGAATSSTTNVSTNVLTTILSVTNTILIPVVITNIDGTTQTNLVVTNVVTSETVLTTNVTTNVVMITTGFGLFTVNPNVQFTLRNLILTAGLSPSGGGILNRGTLVVTNCDFNGNVALGTNGLDGTAGRTSLSLEGGNGGPGGTAQNGEGGAIYNAGTATVLNSRFLTNMAVGGTGGNGGNGGDGSWVGGDGGSAGNGGNARGGAVCNSGTLLMRACSLNQNTAQAGQGGIGGTNGNGIYVGLSGKGGAGGQGLGAGFYNTGTATLEACTLAQNSGTGGNSQKAGSAEDAGLRDGYPGGDGLGGAACNLGHITLVNCTLFLNAAAGGTGGDGGDAKPTSLAYGNGGNGGNAYGGGLYNASWMGLTNCTLSDGKAIRGTNGLGGSGPFPGSPGQPGLARGGNLANRSGTVYVKNSILAHAGSGSNAYGAVMDLGYNLSSDSTPSLTGTGSQLRTDPQIGLLADNGGPVETLALETNSPAINRGDPAFVLATDARGVPRPQGGRGDIGAFELESACLHGRVTLDSAGLAGVTITVGETNVIVTDGSGYYGFTNLPAGTYTVLPELDGFDFSPPVRSVVIGTAVVSADFAATGIFNISGRVTLGDAGLGGVQVTSGSRSATTEANGYYTLAGVAAGARQVTVSLTNYVFVPASQTVTVAAGDLNGVNFGAVPLYRVTGSVTNLATRAPMSNVLITVFSTNTTAGEGVGVWVLTNRTDRQGGFALTNVPAGQIEVRPSLSGFAFLGQRYFTLNTALTNNFWAFRAYAIGGRVTLNGQSLAGVTVEAEAGGTVNGSAQTDDLGHYSITGLTNNSYVVTASLDGYAITNTFSNPVTVGPDKTNANFTAQAALEINGHVTQGGLGLDGVSVAIGGFVVQTTNNGFYQVSSLPPGDYTITPYLGRHLFDPTNLSVTLTDGSATGQDFAAFPLCGVNGRVTQAGAGLSNVTVSASNTLTFSANFTPATFSAQTDTNGYYSLTDVVGGGDVVVTPDLPGCLFTPPDQTLNLLANTNGVDFALQVFNINGQVTQAGVGLSNVTVTASNVAAAATTSAQTDATGYYSLANVVGGSNVVVTPTRAGYIFTPVNQSLNLLANTNGVNFAVSLFNIGGQVIQAGAGLGNVTVTLSNAALAATASVQTDTNGFYSFTNVVGGGIVMVTPASPGYRFNPTNQTLRLLVSTNGLDFAAFPLCSIGGRVTQAGAGLSNVTVTASNAAAAATTSAQSDAEGYYTLVSVAGGSVVTVTPALSGHSFSPASRSLLLLVSTNGIDFQGGLTVGIEGRVTEGSNGVDGVAVVAGNVTNVTAGGGYYLLSLFAGSYGVAPVAPGVGFRPAASNVTLTVSSISNVNFVANPPNLSIAWTTNAAPELTLLGLPLRPYLIWSGTNLPQVTNWSVLFSNTTGPDAAFRALDTNHATAPMRFYKPGTP